MRVQLLLITKLSKQLANQEACRLEGMVFTPLVAETLGGWHEIAVEQIKKLGSALARSDICTRAWLSAWPRVTPPSSSTESKPSPSQRWTKMSRPAATLSCTQPSPTSAPFSSTEKPRFNPDVNQTCDCDKAFQTPCYIVLIVSPSHAYKCSHLYLCFGSKKCVDVPSDKYYGT